MSCIGPAAKRTTRCVGVLATEALKECRGNRMSKKTCALENRLGAGSATQLLCRGGDSILSFV